MHYKDESIRGPHEQLVHQLIQRLGLTPAQVYATQAVKCQTPSNDTPSMDVVTRCASKFLNREIAEMNPRVILAFGDLAWRAVADRFRLDAEDECFKILPVGGSTDFDARRNGMLIKAPHPSTVLRFSQQNSWIDNICEQYVKARAYTRPLTIRETVIQRWENHND
jgi:uracil-DNA glycosylase family 4